MFLSCFVGHPCHGFLSTFVTKDERVELEDAMFKKKIFLDKIYKMDIYGLNM